MFRCLLCLALSSLTAALLGDRHGVKIGNRAVASTKAAEQLRVGPRIIGLQARGRKILGDMIAV